MLHARLAPASLAKLPSCTRCVPSARGAARRAGAAETAATRGMAVFNGKAQCSTCHVPPLFTEPGWNTHKPEEIGIDDFQANRSPEKTYVTQGLKGIWIRKRGFYHDGRFPTLMDVVNHYDSFKNLNLADNEKRDLVEYLKSL